MNQQGVTTKFEKSVKCTKKKKKKYKASPHEYEILEAKLLLLISGRSPLTISFLIPKPGKL